MAAEAAVAEPAQYYKVLVPFLHHEIGSLVQAKDNPSADFAWLLARNCIVPCTAGGIPLMGDGSPPTIEALMQDVEELTEKLEQAQEERDAAITKSKATAENLNRASMAYEASQKGRAADAKVFSDQLARLAAERDALQKKLSDASGGATPKPEPSPAPMPAAPEVLTEEARESEEAKDDAAPVVDIPPSTTPAPPLKPPTATASTGIKVVKRSGK
jgi:hypothetical protein